MSKTDATTAQRQEIARWLTEPLYWATRFGGEDFDPWSGQARLWEEYGKLINAKLKRLQGTALTDEDRRYVNKMGISIMAGQGLGKERSIALMGLHYFFIFKMFTPKGVCTAPAGPTLQSTLWPEFGKVIAGSPYLSAIFDKQADRIFLKEDPKRGEFAWIKPRTIQKNSNPDEQGVVLAGIHAKGVIYLVTEASDVPEAVFRPLEGGLTDPLSLIILIFNPTRRDGFAAETHGKNRQDWVCLQWSGRTLKKEKLEHPGRFMWFNEHAQDVLIRKFGEDSDFVRVRVDGLPPQKSGDSLIHYDAVMAAMDREMTPLETDPLSLGVDVGGEGATSDPSVITVMRGPKVMRQTLYRVSLERLADTVASIVTEERASMPMEAQCAIAIDYTGIGRAVYERLRDVHKLRSILYPIDEAEVPTRASEFVRLRDQIWWELREAFMDERTICFVSEDDERLNKSILIDNRSDLIGQLTSIKWGTVIVGDAHKTKVQGKGSSSGLPGVRPLTSSPNEADSLGLAWYAYRHYCSRVPHALRQRANGWRQKRTVSWKTA